VARVELSDTAIRNLDRLVVTHDLPADTRERLDRRIATLERFPLLGPALEGGWAQYRYILGPWRWMVVVYEYVENDGLVVVTTILDGRSRRAPTTE
jgi:glycosyltransferase A (GT-A) superfamily protein (DUF2064 family)